MKYNKILERSIMKKLGYKKEKKKWKKKNQKCPFEGFDRFDTF